MPELALIIPTYNESENVAPLMEKLRAALAGVDWEAIFVDDDSPDRTWAAVAAIAAADPRVRGLRRVGRRGLSSACIEGMLATAAPVLAVMDADLQHDERILPAMLAKIRGDGCEVVVGTRYAAGGGIGDWGAGRAWMSRFATRLGDALLGKNPTSDPMSGFFMLRREVFEEAVENLSGEGFKILLDILATVRRPLKIGEVPFTFRLREHGESKLSLGVLNGFALLLADTLLGRWVPARFLMFVAVGLLGVGVHFGVLSLALAAGAAFVAAQAAATAVAMLSNFFCNNWFTYSDRKLRGARLWKGLALFLVICGIGALPNLLVADHLYSGLHAEWVLAGGMGMLVSAVWNFSVSRHFIWR